MAILSDEYSGHVEPNGPAAQRRMGGAEIAKVSVGPMDNNAYLVIDAASRDAILIDAAAEPDRIAEVIAAQRPAVRVIGIVTTHRHPDHWQALAAMAHRTGAPVLAGAPDADALPVPVSTRLTDGDRIECGGSSFAVVALRGHTPGSIAVRYDEPGGRSHLFTGDSLFPGGPGRTASPADFTSLMDDLEARVFGVLPDDTWVYPGHGDDTTLGAERPHLAEWRARGW